MADAKAAKEMAKKEKKPLPVIVAKPAKAAMPSMKSAPAMKKPLAKKKSAKKPPKMK